MLPTRAEAQARAGAENWAVAQRLSDGLGREGGKKGGWKERGGE